MKRQRMTPFVLALFGCASTQLQPEAAPKRTPAPDAPPRIESETYALELTSDAAVSTTQPASVSLTIEPRGEYHMNLEFPLRVQLEASAAQLEKASLGPADATQLVDAGARFETHVRFEAAGQQWLSARVLFAVCTPASCVPTERTLTLKVNVR